MGGQPSPTRITLGRLIRRYRDAAGILQAELARTLGYSEGWLSNVETAQLRLRREHVIAIEKALGIPPGVLLEVYDLLEVETLPGWFRPWLDEERKAAVLRWVELSIIPGLLQIEDYARAMLGGDESAVTARMERQAILGRDKPPMLRCVIDEAVLLQERGGAKVMHDQLEHLVNSVSSRVAIQIVPSSVNPHSMGAFILATVDGGEVAYVETAVRGMVTSSRDDIACLSDAWESIRTFALPQQESIEFIKRTAEEKWT